MENNDGCLAVIIGAVIMGLFFLGVSAIGYWSASVACNQRYASFEHKYGFFSGCLIKANDKWVPDKSFYIKEDVR